MNNDEQKIFNSYANFSEINENLDPVGKEDKDINNDGKVDKTDRIIAHRRNIIAKAIKKGKEEAEEKQKKADNSLYSDALYIWDFLLHKKKYSPADAIKIVNLAKTSFEHLV